MAVAAVIDAYRRADLLTYASAISFQIFFALIPLLLFGLGLLGFLNLSDAWRTDLAPDIRSHVSPAAYHLINSTATGVLGRRQLFWATGGALIALWEVSGAMRAVMQVFNRIYGSEERRPFWARMRMSFALAGFSTLVTIAAVVVVRFGPSAVTAALGHGALADVISFVARWGIAMGLLLVLVATLIRFAPDCERPLHLVSSGALVVVVAWLGMSTLFGWYVTSIADYSSVWGSLATVIVLLEYLYLSAIVFLTGVVVDATVRPLEPGLHAASPAPGEACRAPVRERAA